MRNISFAEPDYDITISKETVINDLSIFCLKDEFKGSFSRSQLIHKNGFLIKNSGDSFLSVLSIIGFWASPLKILGFAFDADGTQISV